MSRIYIAKSTKVAARKMGGEMMIMTVRDSVLSSLNELGTAIWDAADGVTPLEEIVEGTVCARFDVARAEALKDAEEFVKDLAEDGILFVSDQPILNQAIQRPSATQESL
jgi:Coenzyme PQQ synthesis protein D (PqqD)